jgi:hypothetical protein
MPQPLRGSLLFRGNDYELCENDGITRRSDSESRTNAELENAESWMTGLRILSVVTDAAATAKGRPYTNDAPFALHGLNRVNASQAQANMHYGSALEFWNQAPLRRHALHPGDSASGLLLVEGQPHVPIVLTTLNVGQYRFQFAFSQTTYDPRFRSSHPTTASSGAMEH